MQLRANAGLLHESNRQRMRAVAVPRKAKLRAKIMHRVVRPTKAFIPRQRHAAEGGCTTWVHRTAASAKCSCVRMQAVAVLVQAKAMLRKRSPSRRSAALAVMSGMQLRANAGWCRAMRATGCECGLLPCYEQRSTAAQTKPFRAGVQRLQ